MHSYDAISKSILWHLSEQQEKSNQTSINDRGNAAHSRYRNKWKKEMNNEDNIFFLHVSGNMTGLNKKNTQINQSQKLHGTMHPFSWVVNVIYMVGVVCSVNESYKSPVWNLESISERAVITNQVKRSNHEKKLYQHALLSLQEEKLTVFSITHVVTPTTLTI